MEEMAREITGVPEEVHTNYMTSKKAQAIQKLRKIEEREDLQEEFLRTNPKIEAEKRKLVIIILL